MPFISPGSVGSHVVAAAACDTSITGPTSPPLHIAVGGDGAPLARTYTCVCVFARIYVSPYTWADPGTAGAVVSPYITDISARRPLCSHTDISVIAGLNAAPRTPRCIIRRARRRRIARFFLSPPALPVAVGVRLHFPRELSARERLECRIDNRRGARFRGSVEPSR